MNCFNPLSSFKSAAIRNELPPLPPIEAAALFHKSDHVEDPPFWVAKNWEDAPELSIQCSIDQRPLNRYPKGVISGYLNLSEADGWDEGHDYMLGEAFTRFMMIRYYFEKIKHLGANKIVLEKVIRAFQKSDRSIDLFFPKARLRDHRPAESRIAFDSEVHGWEKHAVSRLTGNLGSEYNPNKPFFEILVNSARNSVENPYCQPFTVFIHSNEESLEKRRSELLACKTKPGSAAHFVFYSYTLTTASEFLNRNHTKMGPNSTRLIKGLIHLQASTLCAQKVGNCWMKQPMRGLLASLFVELLTHRDDLSIEEAWIEAKALYKDIQKCAAIPAIEELLKSVRMTTPMEKSVQIALEKQKNL